MLLLAAFTSAQSIGEAYGLVIRLRALAVDDNELVKLVTVPVTSVPFARRVVLLLTSGTGLGGTFVLARFISTLRSPRIKRKYPVFAFNVPPVPFTGIYVGVTPLVAK